MSTRTRPVVWTSTVEGDAFELQDEHGWVALERHAPGSHVANLRLRIYTDSRGQGHGKRLIAEALRYAPTQGILRVEATPYADNPASTALFARHPDFEFEGIKRAGGRHADGTLVDTYLFAWVDKGAAL